MTIIIITKINTIYYIFVVIVAVVIIYEKENFQIVVVNIVD